MVKNAGLCLCAVTMAWVGWNVMATRDTVASSSSVDAGSSVAADGDGVVQVVLPAQPLPPGGWHAVTPCSGYAHTHVGCGTHPTAAGGAVGGGSCCPQQCGIHAWDDFVNETELAVLRDMTDRAARWRSDNWDAGPTIVDFNTGLWRGGHRGGWITNATERVIRGRRRRVKPVVFTPSEMAAYRAVFTRIRAAVAEAFGSPGVQFTAPTFVTRIAGDASWVASTPHDEYFHVHIDAVNTGHYLFSGLLYLSTHGTHFDGGQFHMWPPHAAANATNAAAATDGVSNEDLDALYAGIKPRLTMLPRAGRLMLFTSGAEHPHKVHPVLTGVRVCFSMWFTCDPQHALRMGEQAA